jgi:hypothetical protein
VLPVLLAASALLTCGKTAKLYTLKSAHMYDPKTQMRGECTVGLEQAILIYMMRAVYLLHKNK